MNRYSIDHIAISYDEMNENNYKPFILDKIEEYYLKVNDKKLKYKTVLELQKLIKRFPKVPAFYNYLMVAYLNLGKDEEAERVIDKTIKLHPTYIFAIGRKAELLAKEGDIEAARALLKHTRSIDELYPDREEFHYTEVRTYLTAIFFIEAYADNDNNVNAILEAIEDLDESLAHQLRLQYISIRLERKENLFDDIDILKKSSGRLYPLEYIKEPLTFSTKILEILLEQQLTIDFLLQLQTEEDAVVVDDLIQLLRYISHNEEDFYDIENQYIAIDTLLLLGHYKSKKAFETVLEFLRGSSVFLNNHLGDFSTERLWQIIYLTCDANVEALFSFLKEPRIDVWAKLAVNNAIEKLYRTNNDNQATIEALWIDLLKEYLQYSEEDDIVDTSYFAMLIADIGIPKTNSEFADIVKLFFERDWIDISFVGDFEEWLSNNYTYPLKIKDTEDIIRFYDD